VEAAWWGFLGTVIGASTSIATSWIASRSEDRRQMQGDSLERNERARAFQRDNLLELQETIQAAMRYVALIWDADQRASQQAGEWRKCYPLPEDVNDGAHEAGVRLLLLTERVADDNLRRGLKTLRRALTDCSLATSVEDSTALMGRAMETYEPVMEELGTRLRGLY